MTPNRPPSWEQVETLLADLAASGTAFPSATSRRNTISRYERGRRLMLETDTGSRWVSLANIQTCWETFERLGRVRRQDVLEPGRCSAFMVALFAQVAGVDDGTLDGGYLAFAGDAAETKALHLNSF